MMLAKSRKVGGQSSVLHVEQFGVKVVLSDVMFF